MKHIENMFGGKVVSTEEVKVPALSVTKEVEFSFRVRCQEDAKFITEENLEATVETTGQVNSFKIVETKESENINNGNSVVIEYLEHVNRENSVNIEYLENQNQNYEQRALVHLSKPKKC